MVYRRERERATGAYSNCNLFLFLHLFFTLAESAQAGIDDALRRNLGCFERLSKKHM
jgi:hypothetical protein